VREFTKAAISYGWASTCFQMQQLVNMFSSDPETRNSTATGAFNAVAEATAAQLGPTMRSTYRAGDAMQRGVVNMMFGMAGNWMPACDGSRGQRRAAVLADQSAGRGFDALGSATVRPSWRQPRQAEARPRLEPVGGGMSDAGGAAAPGWGPMP
jgi:hypothetical protein